LQEFFIFERKTLEKFRQDFPIQIETLFFFGNLHCNIEPIPVSSFRSIGTLQNP
jgi:hypothetical protein